MKGRPGSEEPSAGTPAAWTVFRNGSYSSGLNDLDLSKVKVDGLFLDDQFEISLITRAILEETVWLLLPTGPQPVTAIHRC